MEGWLEVPVVASGVVKSSDLETRKREYMNDLLLHMFISGMKWVLLSSLWLWLLLWLPQHYVVHARSYLATK